MKRKPDEKAAAICGLFCGTCPMWPDYCGGCLSGSCAADCRVCSNGFRSCAARHLVTRCCDCAEFPCVKLERFKSSHIENGISHHEHVISNLQYMKEHGVAEWVGKQTELNTCPQCGRLVPWNERACPHCGGRY